MTQKLLTKPGEIFLCGNCLKAMCEDCISIADEFQYRDQQRNLASIQMEESLRGAKKEIIRLNRELVGWKRLASLGFPQVIQEWMNSQVMK